MSGATITAGALYGLAGIQASASNGSNISVTTSTGDIINSGGTGINSNNSTTSASSSSQISITANGTINSGFDMFTGGGLPGGIWAGYNNNNLNTVNTSIAGNVSVDSLATINAAAGAGVGLYNWGVGNIGLTLESSSAIAAPLWGVTVYAQGGGNVTITNAGAITSISGVGITTGTGTGVANSVSGVVSVSNSGTIAALGSSYSPVVQINNGSTNAATFTNSGSVTANLYGATSFNIAVAEYFGAVTINNSGTISGNVTLGTASTFNNQAGGVWNIRGQNYFNLGASAIANSGTINMAGISALNAVAGTLAVTNSNTINVAALGFAYIGGAVSGTGTFNISDHAGLEFASTVSSGQTISFGSGKGILTLDNPSGYAGAITGLAAGDIISLKGTSISSASISGSTLTITQSSGPSLSYSVSGALSQNAFGVLSGSAVVLVPSAATVLSGSLGAQAFTPATPQFFQLSGATITSSVASGLNIASSDSNTVDTIFAELNQSSSIAVTGAFNAMNVTTTGANIAVVSAGSISSSGGIGLFANSATGSTTIVDYGNISGTIGIEAVTSGAGSTSIVVGGPAIVTGTSSRGILALTSAGSASVTTMSGSTVSAAGSAIVVESQGTSVPLANNSSLTVQAAGTINSGQVAGSEPAAILVGYMGGASSPASIPNPPLSGIFGNISIDSTAMITASTGIGIDAFNYGTGNISVSNAGSINATAAGTTASGFAQFGIAALNYGTGTTTVVVASGSTINSGSTGILASNEATVIGAAAATKVTVISQGAINSGANVTNGGGAPSAIHASINPGNNNVFNASVYGDVLVNATGNLTAAAGAGIRALNYGIGNVAVNIGNNTVIQATTAANGSGGNAPYGVGAFNFGTGDTTVTTLQGDVITSGSTGIDAVNQATAIAAAENALVTVNAAGTISSGSLATNNGSTPSGISAGFLGSATNGTANTSVNGAVVVNNAANITAAAGRGIEAFNWGNGDVTVNDAAGTNVIGAQYGIAAFAQSGGTGDIAVNIYSGGVVTHVTGTSSYGVLASSTDAGNISVITGANVTITAGSVGINAVNMASAIAASLYSSIVVTNYATVNSGTVVTGTGSPPAGILAGYLGGSTIPTAYPLTGLYGDVDINNFGNITAASGDGIRAYTFGIGDVTVNDGAGTITVQGGVNTTNGYGDGIRATNSGPGDITVTTAAGTVIDAHLGGSGIFAVNTAPAPFTSTVIIPSTSEVTVIARGSISSGAIPTAAGDPAAGILAGYNPNGGSDIVDPNVAGNVLIDDYATITAAAGTDGIRGFNYGIGSVTIITEVGATITGGRYGIGAFAYDGGDVSITNYATVTGTTAALDAQASGAGVVTIDNFGSMSGAIIAGTTSTIFHNESGAIWTASVSTSLPSTTQVINDGHISISAGNSLVVAGTLSGGGQISIGSGASLTLQGQVATTTESILFQGSGTLTLSTAELDSALNFMPVVSGLDPTDKIDFVGAVTSAFWNSGVLTLMNGATAVAYLHLVGDYSSANFTVSTIGGISQIVDPPASVQTIANGTVLELGAPSLDKISFEDTGKLILDQPATFEGQIAGFSSAGDIVALRGFNALQTTADAVYNSQNDTTQLTVIDASDHHSVSLIFDGNYASSAFSIVADPSGGVDVVSTPSAASKVVGDAALGLNDSVAKLVFESETESITSDQPATLVANLMGSAGAVPDATHSDATHIEYVGPRPGFCATSNPVTNVLDEVRNVAPNFVDFTHNLSLASEHHGGTWIIDSPARVMQPDGAGSGSTCANNDQFRFNSTFAAEPDSTIGDLSHGRPNAALEHFFVFDPHNPLSDDAWFSTRPAAFGMSPFAGQNAEDRFYHETIMPNLHGADFVLPNH